MDEADLRKKTETNSFAGFFKPSDAYHPDTFLCLVIVFATFVASRNAHIITTIA